MPESRRVFIRDETFAAIVALGIVACQWWIMDDLRLPTKWAVWTAAAVLLAAILALRLVPGTHWRVRYGLREAFIGVLIVANAVNLVALGAQALFDASPGATELLFTGAVLWTMNVLVFGLAYWVIDGGGPEARAGDEPVTRDWVFPQQGDERTAPGDWHAMFGDYLYLGFTGAIAFGPTDAMPYSRRAKALMAIEGTLALAILGVVIARAVSLATS
jgi:hypothetical protein